MILNEKTDLIAAIGKLETQTMVNGRPYIKRIDVIELIMCWPVLYPTTYHVVATANPLTSPFPDEIWPTREQAEKFANEDAPNGWAGKLTVVP